MIVTSVTKRALRYRRAVRVLRSLGYEEVNESGGKLWELVRGRRYDHIITDVKLDPERKTIWIKTERMPCQ